MEPLIDAISQNPAGNIAVILTFAGGIVIALVAIVLGAVRATTTRKEFERSRREIAAYIAEGAMTPEQGERLLALSPHNNPSANPQEATL